MAARALICKECKKPARDEAADCRYCGAPLPRPAATKCATCAGVVTDLAAPCTHCGAPKASARAANSQLLRCAQCSSQVSTDAEACPRCKAPTPGLTAVLPQLSAERRAAEQGPTEAVAAALSGTATGLKQELALPESALNRSLEQGVRANVTAADRKELAKQAGPSGPSGPCRVCGRPNPADAYVCMSCGIPLRQAPQSTVLSPGSARGLPWLKSAFVTALIVLLFAGGQWFRVETDDHDREARLRNALGPAATDKDVATLKQRAGVLGVTPEALVAVHRKCFLTPDRIPSEVEMAQAVVGADEGEPRAKKLVEYAGRRCATQ